jgi:pyroglutamyl-peptidase
LAPQKVLEAARDIEPDVIISVGQAGTRDSVTPERIGINMRSARIADNAGRIPVEESIVPGGPDGMFSTLPVAAMVDAIRAADLPAAISNTAGTFVCNDTLYSLLHHYQGTPVRCGFIHVPWLPEQGTPNLTLEHTVQALIAAISAL